MDHASECDAAPSTVAREIVHRLEFDVDWPPGHVAAYLIDGPEPVLVDAGGPSDVNERELIAGLDAIGYAPEDVDHVVVTHPHTDHIGQVPAMLDAGARLYAPRAAVEQLERDPNDLAAGVRETAIETGLDPEGVDQHIERAVQSLERSRRLLPPERVDVAFAFDGSFAVGDHEFEPVHTPGHQIHHAAFRVAFDGTHALFSGDALIEPFRAAALHVGLDHGAYDAIAAFYRGFDRLEGLGVDRVYPGHGPTFDDFAGVLQNSRDRLDGTVASVERTLRERGRSSPIGLTLARVEKLEHPAVLLDTVGALGYLEDRSRATFEYDEDGVRRYRARE